MPELSFGAVLIRVAPLHACNNAQGQMSAGGVAEILKSYCTFHLGSKNYTQSQSGMNVAFKLSVILTSTAK